jgi:hypothetical protein
VAQAEFDQLSILLDHPSPTLALAGGVPAVGSKVTTARELVYVGQDATTLGLNLLQAATPILSRLHAGALAATTQPLITQQEAATLRAAVVNSMGLIDDIESRVASLDPNELPITACQRIQYQQLVSKLPEVRYVLSYTPQLFDAATWILGVDGPRQFLVQTMDTSELRATGGFTGELGVLDITSGRVKPFSLKPVDDFYLNTPYSLRPPAVYDWWPFPRWGLRDSNVSPDFPITAKINMALFTGIQHIWRTMGLSDSHLDGVIMVTPAPVADILKVTGPLTVPKFGDTVTSANLADVIHYYNNVQAGIDKERAICNAALGGNQSEVRKCFMTTLATLLEDHVRQMSLSQLLGVAQTLLGDMKTHEIQVFVTNPAVEDLLLEHGYGTHLTSTPGQDTLMIDQSSPSVSKASTIVQVTVQDTVTLDKKGGAEHHVLMTIMNPHPDPFSYITTYRDYVRVYVPPQAQLQWANGFDTGRPVCWEAPPSNPGEGAPQRFKSLPSCPTVGFFPDGSLQCPPGDWGPGPRSNDAFGADGSTDYPVDDTGYPTSTTSDVPGFTMYGGFVTVPVHCKGVVTLNYYVPNAALPASAVPAKAGAYTLTIVRQAGTYVAMHVQVHPAAGVAGESSSPVSFDGTFSADQVLVIPRTTG